MNCRGWRKPLARYHDDSLDDSGRQRVEEHLAACHRCRDSLAELASIRDLFQAASSGTPPQGLAQRVGGGVARQHQGQQLVGRWLRGAAAAAVVAWVAASLSLARQPEMEAALAVPSTPAVEVMLSGEDMPQDMALRLAVYAGAPSTPPREPRLPFGGH